jgi:hypothetical protein
MDGDLTQPYGLSRHLLPVPTPTDPIPVLDPGPMSHEPLMPPVKAAETCGPCGSTFSVEWVGRTDTLKVIRDWRRTHRCESPAPDAAGIKVGHIERVGFAQE